MRIATPPRTMAAKAGIKKADQGLHAACPGVAS